MSTYTPPPDRYRPSDLVRIMAASLYPSLVGTKARIIRGREYMRVPGKSASSYVLVYTIATVQGVLHSPESALSPWTDCYDKCAWGACDWQPAGVNLNDSPATERRASPKTSGPLPTDLSHQSQVRRLQTASERLRAAAELLRMQLRKRGEDADG